ncbi:hypothetical protein TcCL_ESM10859 [Trypanosoma cruzi]|nr:hypothetical protein TcCL_ESM10859 [Trypanosoma cruzi]
MPLSPPNSDANLKFQLSSASAQLFVYQLTPFCPACHFDWIVWKCFTTPSEKAGRPFHVFNFILRAGIFSTCSVGHSDSEVSATMRAWDSSCHVDCGQHRGAATLTPQSCCVFFEGWQGNSMQPATAALSPNLSLHANNVLHRVGGMIGVVCTLVLFASFCGYATLEWWENGAGRCMAASLPLFTARWCSAHCAVGSAI